MSILGLAGKHIYKQTGKRRTEASLLCFTWIGQLESLLKKTLANERTSGSHQDTFSIIFPTEHASILWPGLIFCRFSFALADVFKRIKLKILSFWGGEEFNINHCFLCNICLIRKNILLKTSTDFCQVIFHRKSQRFNPHHHIWKSYTKLLQTVLLDLPFYWPNQILRSFPLTKYLIPSTYCSLLFLRPIFADYPTIRRIFN